MAGGAKKSKSVPAVPAPLVLRLGAWVQIAGMGGVGRVLELDERRKRARVLVGSQEWVFPLKNLTATAVPVVPESRNLVRVIGQQVVSHEIDLHGMRVEEALEMADRGLDQAVVNNLTQFKIIHGHGTGAVRTAVRQMLTHHPHVAHYRFGGPAEGGLACTIVELRPARP